MLKPIGRTLEQRELVAVADIEHARAEGVGGKYSEKAYINYEEMFKAEKLDLVSIATPDNQHVATTMKTAEDGINILVDKAIAMNLPNADKTIASVMKNNVNLMVNFILRFDQRYRTAYELVSSDEIGEVITIWGRSSTLLETAKKYGKFSNLLHGVIIHDINMFNLISISELFQPYCVSVKETYQELDIVVSYVEIIKYKNVVAASFEISWVLPQSSPHWLEATLRIIRTNGAIYLGLQSHGLEFIEGILFKARLIQHAHSRWGLMGNLKESLNISSNALYMIKSLGVMLKTVEKRWRLSVL